MIDGGGFSLVLLSLAMFVGSMVSGYVPLQCAMSTRTVQRWSVFGAGLLVGTALVVIIPEGIHMWYAAQVEASGAHDHAAEHAGEGEGHTHEGEHWQIGASLVFGFAFMLIVDAIGGGHGHGHDDRDHDHRETKDIELQDLDHHTTADARAPPQDNSRNAATLGLLIHAAVDGIALGAAALAGDAAVGMIVFMAIMLHKAPASFGLASYLLRKGLPRAEVQKQLLTFALAAPVTAVLTYYMLLAGIVGASQRMLAVCFMFSGGTFLFVSAAHILPDIKSESDSEDQSSRYTNMWLMVAGLLLPMTTNLIGHGH